MSVGKAKAHDTRGQLIRVLEPTGISHSEAVKIVNAINELVNAKIAKSEGKHHAKFHATPRAKELEHG